MIARAVAVGSGADASTECAAPVGLASGGEPAGPMGPVPAGASEVGDSSAATLSPGVPDTRVGDSDDPASGDPMVGIVAPGDPASVAPGELGSGDWLSPGVGLAAAPVPTAVAGGELPGVT